MRTARNNLRGAEDSLPHFQRELAAAEAAYADPPLYNFEALGKVAPFTAQHRACGSA